MPGAYADLVVLDARATPAMAHRMETIRDLEEELFVLMTMGDDRAVRQTYIAGEPALPGARLRLPGFRHLRVRFNAMHDVTPL